MQSETSGASWGRSQGGHLSLAYVATPPAPVHGVLTKYVNLGKGFRPRYFVLSNGVLAYYKARRKQP